MRVGLEDGAIVDPGVARRALERAAGRVVRAWALSLGISAVVALTSLAITVGVAVYGVQQRPLVVFWALLTVGSIYNVTRFIPRASRHKQSTPEDGLREVARLEDWVSRQCSEWRPRLRFTPFPEVATDMEFLVLGLPLLACLRENELAALVQDRHDLWRSEQVPVIRRACALADGGIGRGIEGANATWINRRLAGGFYRRVAELIQARNVHDEVLREGRDESWDRVVHRVEVVLEGWDILARQWLNPALQRGVWHDDLSGGLRAFIDACEEASILDDAVPRPPGPDVGAVFPDLAAQGASLAEQLVAEVPHDAEPTAWADHPWAVTEPSWRSKLSAGLEAARRATGQPQPASLETLLGLLEQGWGTTIAALMRPRRDQSPVVQLSQPEGDSVLHELLEATVSVAILESGAATLEWHWPFGTVLLGLNGQALPVQEMVTNPGHLRSWLHELGVDPSAPLWLAGGRAPVREHALGSFVAYQGLANRRVVLSDRAVRVFSSSQGNALRENLRTLMHGPTAVLGDYVDAVDRGDLTGQVASVMLDEVVRATFAAGMGGHWWRLRIRTASGPALALRGDGTGREIEEWFAETLGERLHTRWLHAPSLIRRARAVFGYLCLAFGGFGVVMAGILVFSTDDGVPVGDALLLGAASVAIVTVGLVPDLIAALIDKLSGAQPHRHTDPR